MKEDFDVIVAIIGVLTGAIRTWLTVKGYADNRQKHLLKWTADETEKRVNIVRDYEHLKRNYLGLIANLETLVKEQDSRFDRLNLEIKEVKNLLNMLLVHPSRELGSTGYSKREMSE